MKKILIIKTIVAVLFLSQSCGKKEIEQTKTIEAISVVVNNNNEIAKHHDFVSASGKIEAENSANLSTRMMGYVTNVPVKVGQKVAAGQLLVKINSTDLQAKKAQVDASIIQAQAAYNNAKKDYERFEALFAQQSASQKELDDMTSRFEMAKAGLEAAKQMKNEVNAQFSYTNITAPFSGVVTNVFVKQGDMANPGMPLVAIEGSGRLTASVMVSETNISEIEKGMMVKIFVKSINQSFDGKVSELSLSSKNTGGQYVVKVDINKPTKDILSGMFVNVQFPIKASENQESASKNVLVPVEAIVKQGQLNGVFVVNENKTAILRWVRLGKTHGNEVEVLSGLTANETYVISAKGRLFNGATVSIQ